MNVVISNERQDELSNLDVDIIKNLNGVFSADEIVSTFKNFYYNKMILDVTAIQDYLNVANIQKLATGLDIHKIIFLLPNTKEASGSLYLQKLVSIGVYNFTNNIPGVEYLLTHQNTYEDVSYVENMDGGDPSSNSSFHSGTIVLGVKDITDHAGATSLIYMMKRELERVYGETVYAVEVNRHDLEYFNVKNTISTNKEGLSATINKLSDATAILVDLNDMNDISSCTDVIYLIEPSSLMLNKLMRTNKMIFQDLKDKKIVLNKSLLSAKDVSQFEYEANTQVFHHLPTMDERRKNDEVVNLLMKLGFFGNKNDKKDNRFLGLFKI